MGGTSHSAVVAGGLARARGLGFGFWGLGFRVWGLGFRGLGFGV